MAQDDDPATTRYFVFRPGRDIPTEIEAALPPSPSHDDIEAIVAPIVGGRMLHLVVLFHDAPASMLVYEFRDRENFELNDAATALFRQAAIKENPETDPEQLPVIKGSAVVFDRIILPLPRPIV